MQELIPPVDPLGIPSPPFIFTFLYILTFFLHLLFMNYILGGMLVVAVNEWFFAKNPVVMRGNALAVKVMPIAFSLAITMGVAPLLFVQVLYGQFFYTANIIMGWWWMAIIGMTTVGFYLLYVMIAKRPDPARSTTITKGASLTAFLLFLFVAFLFTNNAVLTDNPRLWKDAYTGVTSAYALDATLIPRFLHNVFGALVVAGVWLAVIGRYQEKFYPAHSDVAAQLEKSGLLWALIAVVIQFVTGFIYLGAMGLDRIRPFMQGGLLFYGWTLGVLLAVGALSTLIIAYIKPEKKRMLWVAAGHVIGTLFCMAMGRQLLRENALSEYFDASELVVRPSYSSLVLFLVTFAAGLAVVVYMVRMVWNLPPKSEEE